MPFLFGWRGLEPFFAQNGDGDIHSPRQYPDALRPVFYCPGIGEADDD